ncbi:MAG: sulfoxide reductase heme-binding subunit YedZ [endosymbiont of Galathealinum brachiosum]|uniref:Protein-methionine-sulfoxide reductase heme-binding subunit MsrQ n=1 Tax=endosymbiont of Galathealinum brachiosum TaxID=2200906 RepID=A0A370DMJ7_9GAMM|nr:MAG: sulfoxide reductase heme-binding subunit YedZ [endosymbiont of Galathealinum brachiosum]
MRVWCKEVTVNSMNAELSFFSSLKNFDLRLFVKPLVFILCLMPFALLMMNALNNNLGPNPVEEMIRTLGDWGIYFLLTGLFISPARKVFNQVWLIRYRRMMGLFAFFYVSMHFLGYIWFEQFFNVQDIVKDIIKRPFISIGFICYLLLVPLAVTSTAGMMKRLKKNWGRLHKVVYPVSVLALLHYFMMVKADFLVPGIMLVILSVLLGYRLVSRFKS